jgi:3-oxoacyl-[acyl-carrier protein] reductase
MNSAMTQAVLRAGNLAGEKELAAAERVSDTDENVTAKAVDLCLFLASDASKGITGRLISAQWDNWREWPSHLQELVGSDLYTLRRIAGRDRGQSWGDL